MRDCLRDLGLLTAFTGAIVKESLTHPSPRRGVVSCATDERIRSTQEATWPTTQSLSSTENRNRTDRPIAPIQTAKAAKSYGKFTN